MKLLLYWKTKHGNIRSVPFDRASPRQLRKNIA